MKRVKIFSHSHRAENRVREHGNIFLLRKVGHLQGMPGIFIESIEKQKDGLPWFGWFTEVECRWEIQDN